MANQKWRLLLTLEVSDNWIQDGANPSEWMAQIKELIEDNFLTYAYENEFKVSCHVESQPHKDVIEKILKSA